MNNESNKKLNDKQLLTKQSNKSNKIQLISKSTVKLTTKGERNSTTKMIAIRTTK